MSPPRGNLPSGGWKENIHELLRKIASGDEPSLEEFIERFSPHLKSLIRYLAGSVVLPDEEKIVLNQIYVKIWLKARTYKGPDDGRSGHRADATAWAWIRTLAKNHVRDIVKVLKKEREREIVVGDAISPKIAEKIDEIGDSPFDHLLQEPYSQSPQEMVIIKEVYKEFRESLNEQETEIFDMLGEGLSQKEVAEVLGMSRSRISQIVKNIRKKADNTII